jgi:hypothetical protein
MSAVWLPVVEPSLASSTLISPLCLLLNVVLDPLLLSGVLGAIK